MSKYNETEWESVLRKKGIIGAREPDELELQEEQLEAMVDAAIQQRIDGPDKTEMTLDELDAALEDEFDEEEERLLEKLRRERLAQLRDAAMSARFGRVTEINKSDWVREVTEAGPDVPVLVLVTRAGNEHGRLLEQHCRALAGRFPSVKFCRGEAQLCIPDYPERNLPTLLLYQAGGLLQQWVGSLEAAQDGRLTESGLEWRLAQKGALETELRSDPCGPKGASADSDDEEDGGGRRRLQDVMARDMARCNAKSEAETNGSTRRIRQGENLGRRDLED